MKRKKIAINKDFSFGKLLPNMLTLTAICFGLSSIRYALDKKWQIAVALIVIAGLLDLIDGRVARYFKSTSRFGAHLDSLADFIDFGAAPAIVIYLWKLQEFELKGMGWALVLFYTVCCAVRLARFNAEEEIVKKEEPHNSYFSGVPAPMGAYLIIIPIMLELNPLFHVQINKWIEALIVIITALLMVSKVPTISTKNLSIKPSHVNMFFACFALAIALLIIQPWIILPLAGLVYICSIPYFYYFKIKKGNK